MAIMSFIRNATIAEMSVEMDRRGRVIEELEARIEALQAERDELKAREVVGITIIPWEPGKLGLSITRGNGSKSAQPAKYLPNCRTAEHIAAEAALAAIQHEAPKRKRTIDESELDEWENACHEAIIASRIEGGLYSVSIKPEAFLPIIAAARALSSEKAAREEAERERDGWVAASVRQNNRAQTAEYRATTAEAETARLRERVKEMEEALAPFVGALAAYRAVHRTRIVAGSTEADRRFSQGEIDDTAVEALFEAVADLGVEPFFAAEAAAIRSRENSNAE